MKCAFPTTKLSKTQRQPMFWLIMVGCCIMASPASAQDAKEIRTAIFQAWKEREQQTETLDCRWSARVCKGANSTFINDERMNPIPFPSEDFFFQTEYRFRFIGQRKYRYEYTGPQLSSFTKSYEVSEYTSVTDGEVQAQPVRSRPASG